ncbi:hypothetical protein [Candidatus Regiella insecticola]|uniref:hypothetical protein n=1 Tax=Candidatus Regiella insecticola TaxID=138073 RepID=UPI000906F494|nr:hypothetical protein [Candidatus Regiella insecticola]
MNFELRQGGKGDRPMSVDILRDSASTRRQQSRNLKGEGYMNGKFRATVKREFIWIHYCPRFPIKRASINYLPVLRKG